MGVGEAGRDAGAWDRGMMNPGEWRSVGQRDAEPGVKGCGSSGGVGVGEAEGCRSVGQKDVEPWSEGLWELWGCGSSRGG